MIIFFIRGLYGFESALPKEWQLDWLFLLHASHKLSSGNTENEINHSAVYSPLSGHFSWFISCTACVVVRARAESSASLYMMVTQLMDRSLQ